MLRTAAFVHLDLAVHLGRMMNDDAEDADEIDINDDYYDDDEIDNHLFFALTVDLSQVRVSLQVQSQVPAQILQICKSGKFSF